MTIRTGSCRCGRLSVECRGDPVRVSVCHCLDCKRRTGAAFSAQARWADADVTLSGEPKAWTHVNEEGNSATFLFCPDCGSPIAYTLEVMPGVTAIPIGAFADPDFPAPAFSVYESRKHKWVDIVGDDIIHD